MFSNIIEIWINVFLEVKLIIILILFLIKKAKGSTKGFTLVKRGCELSVDDCDAAVNACKAAGGSDCKCKTCNSYLCNDSKSIHDLKFKTIGAVLLAAVLSMFYY